MDSGNKYDIEEMAGFAGDIIRQTGDRALEFYGKGKPQIKFDEDLVTKAELSLFDFFTRQLETRFPDHHAFRDNVNIQEYSHEAERYLWIFDPLDGVANFQAGIPIWGTSLALLDNYWPILGLFYMPATGDLFQARADKDAYWGDERIYITNTDPINDESVLLTYSRFHQNFHSIFPGKVRSLGCTSAHICYVAMGRADAAVIANESFQDLAAARVIIEAAGGDICRLDGSKFYLNDYLNGRRIEEHLLVASPEKVSQIQKSLKSIV